VADDVPDQLTCATYTHARRHPMVLGQIGGWTPPFQLTLPQLGVVIVAYLVEVKTWRWWGALLPPTMAVLVGAGMPCVLAWLVRHARIEGRSLPRAVLGWLMLAWSPRAPLVGGRAYRPQRATAAGRVPVYLAAGDDEP
jgi:hypothetical protein